MTLHDQMVHAVTGYDRKQAGKRSYNRYALGRYLERVADIEADVGRGADVRKAIVAAFTGKLLDAVLRGIGQPIATKDEETNRTVCYQPVTPE
jgi:hypothetical protein